MDVFFWVWVIFWAQPRNPAAMEPWNRGKAIVLCCCPPHGAISCRELPSHPHESQAVLLTLREPLRNRRALWSSLGLVNHDEQHRDRRQWERRDGSVNAKRGVSKHKVIKYSYQGTEENLWELARQTEWPVVMFVLKLLGRHWHFQVPFNPQ